MSRRTPRVEPGLDALRAAVAAVRGEELSRSARAALVARDLLEPGRLPAAGRVTGRGGRLGLRRLPVPRPDTPEAGQPGDGTGTDPAAAGPDDPAATDTGAAHTAGTTQHVVPDHAGPAVEPTDDAAAADAAPPTAETYALVERAQAGDADAFAELYDHYLPVVYRYLVYRTGNRERTEDLTSETFLRGWRRIDSFTWQGRDLGAWFVTIARNLLLDEIKSSRYRLEISTDDMSASGATPPVPGPEGEVIAGLDARAVVEAVRQLRPDQQECVSLRFLQGMSLAETAAVLGRSEGAVKALQGRALRNLSKQLPAQVQP